MPSKRTTNYQLCQWDASDRVHHDDFNEDNLKIDTAIKAEETARTAAVSAIQSTLSTLRTAVEGKQDASGALRLAAGSYTGTTNPSGTMVSGSQTISLGFKPQAVLVVPREGRFYTSSGAGFIYGGLAVAGTSGFYGDHTTIEITSSGFRVHSYWNNSAYSHICLNDKDKDYHYIALG